MHHTKNPQELNSDLTPEVMNRVDKVIERYADKPGALIPVLTECQGIVGYVPVELQEYIAKGLNVPGSSVYGVVTFYSFFTMEPKGRHTIKLCLGTACYVRGIAEVRNRIISKFGLEDGKTTEDRRFSLQTVRCLGACGLAPVMLVDQDTHGGVSSDKAVEILERYA